MTNDINRLKLVLTEKKIQAKWLAKQSKKDPATIMKQTMNKGV